MYSAFGGSAPRPPLGLCLWTTLGDFCPQTPGFVPSETNSWLLSWMFIAENVFSVHRYNLSSKKLKLSFWFSCCSYWLLLCSLEAGLKAYADSVKKHKQQLKEAAVVEPRSARERNVAAEVARAVEKCHKPRPLDGRPLLSLVWMMKTASFCVFSSISKSLVWKFQYKISEMIGLNVHILCWNWFINNTAVLFS